MSCVFCRIVAGEQPASVVHHDDLCWAFMDIRPVRRGHVLVIPVAHAVHLHELDDPIRARIWEVGQRIADAHRASALTSNGHNFLLNDGKAANQTVAHAHLHVIPRAGGDFLATMFRLAKNLTGIGTIRRDALDTDADEIRQHLPLF
ncbi:MAG: HIT domain-containing protein [bacterium]|nr:HIT domain-containing protein [bacterium]